ncbi:MAG: ATP-binding protein, partial [Eubacterium sp.]
VLQAELDQLETALTFVDTILENLKADHKTRNQCALITEEIFVNICHYAYNEKGDITLSCTADQRERCLTLEFADKGKPFNPLEKEDPLKITETEEKTPGGYGIYMAKQLSDHMEYHYKEGENHLKIIKHYSVI